MSDCSEISGDFSVSQDLVDNVERLTDRISQLISLFKDKKDKLSPIKTAEALQESELKYESDTKDSEIHRLMTEIAEVKVSFIWNLYISMYLFIYKEKILWFLIKNRILLDVTKNVCWFLQQFFISPKLMLKNCGLIKIS